MYIYLVNNIVQEIIPGVNKAFPHIPIEERYTAEFLKSCVAFPNDVRVEQNWVYDPETGDFTPPSSAEIQESIENTTGILYN